MSATNCPICHEPSPMDFHHWEYYGDGNGLEICRSCHDQIHGGVGRRVTDQGQTADILAADLAPGFDGLFRDWRDMELFQLSWMVLEKLIEKDSKEGVEFISTFVTEPLEISAGFALASSSIIADKYNIPDDLVWRLAMYLLMTSTAMWEIMEYGPIEMNLHHWSRASELGWLTQDKTR